MRISALHNLGSTTLEIFLVGTRGKQGQPGSCDGRAEDRRIPGFAGESSQVVRVDMREQIGRDPGTDPKVVDGDRGKLPDQAVKGGHSRRH